MDLCVEGHPGLQSEFQGRQSIQRETLSQNKKAKTTKKLSSNTMVLYDLGLELLGI